MRFGSKEYGKPLPRMELPKETVERFVESLERPTVELLTQLETQIENREYDCVLGDDAAARLHALLMGKVIKNLYGEEKNLEVAFVQGGVLMKKDKEHRVEVKNYLKRIEPLLGKRVLFVTEDIYSGNSVLSIALLLKEMGIEVDVASYKLSAVDDEDIDILKEKFASEEVPLIYASGSLDLPEAMSGVLHRMRSGEGTAMATDSSETSRHARVLIKGLADKISNQNEI